MDALGDLVKEACRLIRGGEIFAAHAQLQAVVVAARASPPTDALGACLYAWLLRISDAAESVGLPGGRIDSALAGEFAEQLPHATLIDRFEARFILILEEPDTAEPSSQATVARSKRYIDANSHRGVRIAEVARRVGCSGSTLRKAWREVEGPDSVTPTTVVYLELRHVEDAKPLLLANPGKSIDQVADEVGCSRRSLDRGFKKFEGMTAAEWRRRNLPSKRSA